MSLCMLVTIISNQGNFVLFEADLSDHGVNIVTLIHEQKTWLKIPGVASLSLLPFFIPLSYSELGLNAGWLGIVIQAYGRLSCLG